MSKPADPEVSSPGLSRLQQLNGLLEVALDLPQHERESWLGALPIQYQELRPTLAKLLARAELETDDFLCRAVDQSAVSGEIKGEEAQAGETVGPYRLIRPIGQGGMAVVWLAERDEGVARQVALKLPAVGWVGGLTRRIARERDILASLEHRNIARLYEAGETPQGRPWLAMEYVHGQPLDAYLQETELSLRERLMLFLQIADAVAYAHSRLVVHRDLKPGNILVTADGEARLLDFGVAKLLLGDDDLDQLTRQIGYGVTPDYAAPEQLEGGLVTAATDVYGLGVVLFQMLADAQPYTLGRQVGAGLAAALQKQNVPAPSRHVANRQKWARVLRGDLDNIVRKATRKEPGERYASAEAFAADVRRYLQDKPVVARPPEWRYLASKFVVRNRIAVGTLSVVLVSLSVGFATSFIQWREADRQRLHALEHMARSEATGDFVNTVLLDTIDRDKPLAVGDLLARSQRFVSAAPNPLSLAMSTDTLASWMIQLGDPAAAEVLLATTRASLSRQEFPQLWQRLSCLHANALSQLARPQEASALLEDVFRSISADADTRSYCLLHRTYVVSREAEADGAAKMERYALEGLSLLDGAGLTFTRRRALLNAELADAYATQGRASDADSRFEDAYSLLQAIGKADSLNGMSVFANWAAMHLRFGSPKRALEMYLQAKEIAQRRAPGAQVNPVLLIQISNAMRQVGRAEEAAQSYRVAVDVARKARSSRAEAFALIGLALSVMESKLDRSEAQQWLDRARALVGASVADPRTAQGASWLVAQAQTWHYDDQSRKAHGLLDTSVQQLVSGSSPSPALVNLLMWRGIIASEIGWPADAQRDLEQALSHAKRLPAPRGHSSHIGRVAIALAEHHLREGRPEAAELHARLALSEFEPSVGADSLWVVRAKEFIVASTRTSLAASETSR
jgi:eukaryotic-like serine/threonine-protein kinase